MSLVVSYNPGFVLVDMFCESRYHTDHNGKYHNHRLTSRCTGQECNSADIEHGCAEVECACTEVAHGYAEVECACAEVALRLR